MSSSLTPRSSTRHPNHILRSGRGRCGRIAIIGFVGVLTVSLCAPASATVPPPPTVSGGKTPTTPIVSASQAPIVQDPDGRWVVPFTRASLAGNLVVSSADDPIEFEVPIPAGLRLVEMRGTFNPRDEGPGAIVEVNAGVRTIEIASPEGTERSFSLVLDGLAPVSKITRTFGVSIRLKPSAESVACPRSVRNPATLTDLKLVLAGTSGAPTSLANFLPPVLDSVVIETDAKITNEIAQAALHLVTTVIAKYPDQSIRVELVPLKENRAKAKFDPFVRRFRLLTSSQNALTLKDDGSVLELSGNPAMLERAATFVGTPAFSTVFSTRVSITDKTPVPPKRKSKRETVPLERLRRNFSAQGANRARYLFTIRQTDVGGPSAAMTLRMKGRVVSVTGPASTASVRLIANGRPIATSEVSLGDAFDMQGVVEPEFIARENEIVVQADAIIDPKIVSSEVCPLGAVVRVELDADSAIITEPGRSVPSGFERFPTAFHDTFDVSINPLDVDHLATAASIVAALQERSQATLEPKVIPWPKKLPNRSALLVGGTVEQVVALKPPLVPGPFSISGPQIDVVGGNEADDVTVLEAFEAPNEAAADLLLVNTSATTKDLIDISRRVRAVGSGWNGLSGDVFVVSSGQARSARLRASERVPSPILNTDRGPKKTKPVTALAAGIAAAVVGLGLYVMMSSLIRRIRRR
jgi:hypothetical protein